MRLTQLAAAAAIVATTSLSAHAALTTYKGSGSPVLPPDQSAADSAYDSFAGQLLTKTEEKLETSRDFIKGTTLEVYNLNIPQSPFLFGDSAITSTNALARLSGDGLFNDDTSGGRSAFAGSVYLQGGVQSFSVEFFSAVRAFGFWGTDIGDFGTPGAGVLVLDLAIEFDDKLVDLPSDTNCAGAVGATVLTCSISGGESDRTESFWGLIATSGPAITKVTFTNKTVTTPTTGPAVINDLQGFRGFVTGTVAVEPGGDPVPEPGTLLLAALGLTAAARARRGCNKSN